jgi:hypothetical protein
VKQPIFDPEKDIEMENQEEDEMDSERIGKRKTIHSMTAITANRHIYNSKALTSSKKLNLKSASNDD